jgi:hypothetical protein
MLAGNSCLGVQFAEPRTEVNGVLCSRAAESTSSLSTIASSHSSYANFR